MSAFFVLSEFISSGRQYKKRGILVQAVGASTFAIGAKSRVFLILNNLGLVNPIR